MGSADDWSWGAIFAHVATSTGWTLDHCRDQLTLHDLAALVGYWRRYPPVHISLATLMRGLSGGTGSARTSSPPPRPSAPRPEGATPASAMEGVAALLGPPQQKFRPPCRMQETPE